MRKILSKELKFLDFRKDRCVFWEDGRKFAFLGCSISPDKTGVSFYKSLVEKPLIQNIDVEHQISPYRGVNTIEYVGAVDIPPVS